MQRALLLPVTFIALALVACSSSSGSGSPSSTGASSTSTSSPASTTAPESSTTAAPTSLATVPPTVPPAPTTLQPAATAPPATAPAPTVPADGCLRPDSAHEPVEILITDDGVTINGLPLTTCMKVPESFRLRFINNSSLEQNVGFGDAGGPIAVGADQLTDPMGEIYSVGDHFDIVFAWIEWTIDVEVLPISG